MSKSLLVIKPFIFIDKDGKEFVNPNNKDVKSYITARSFRNAMQESNLPKEFVDWFIKDPYNGRARFVTRYKRELYENYKRAADYISYNDPAFVALEAAGICDKSCLSEMEVSKGTKAKKYLLLMGAEIAANFVKYSFSEKYPGEQLSVIIEEPQKVLVKESITFLNPVKQNCITFTKKLF